MNLALQSVASQRKQTGRRAGRVSREMRRDHISDITSLRRKSFVKNAFWSRPKLGRCRNGKERERERGTRALPPHLIFDRTRCSARVGSNFTFIVTRSGNSASYARNASLPAYSSCIHRGSNLFDKRFFPVKYWIIIAYAVSCCLLP